MGVAFKFWPGVEGEHIYPYVNVMRAHKNVVRFAKDNDLEKVIVGEDDIRFSAKGAWEYYLSSMPDDFDVYLGMIYCGNIPDNRVTTNFAGLQLYTVHKRHYDFFLDAPETMHLDMYLGEWAYKHDYFVCDPFVCYGEPGYSDNTKQMWNHAHCNLPNKLYGSEA